MYIYVRKCAYSKFLSQKPLPPTLSIRARPNVDWSVAKLFSSGYQKKLLLDTKGKLDFIYTVRSAPFVGSEHFLVDLSTTDHGRTFNGVHDRIRYNISHKLGLVTEHLS